MELIGKSPLFIEAKKNVERFINSDIPILLVGETGTGKTLLAEHYGTLCNKEPFVKINCAAIPNTLLESELFGHEKGSFTGSDKRKTGLVEKADGGILFLDEIGEMSNELQAKLLQVLDSGNFYRVGGTQLLKSEFKLLTATNKDIIKLTADGIFRKDLFYRISGVIISLKPLCERREDIPLLIKYFLKNERKKMSKKSISKLESYHWPGNVRELMFFVKRLCCYCDEDIIKNIDFEFDSVLHSDTENYIESLIGMTLKEATDKFKEAFVKRNVEVCATKTDAAKVMGIQRTYLSKILGERKNG